MSDTFQLCLEQDLNEDEPFECEGPNGEAIVVVLHNGAVYAVAGECPHQAAPLADAEVEDGKITCCLHFWTWDLRDGSPVEEADVPLPTYPVVVEDGRVLLKRSGSAAS